MGMSIYRVYRIKVTICYYTEDILVLTDCACGQMDSIAEKVCKILAEHNLDYADVFSSETGDLLMVIKRS